MVQLNLEQTGCSIKTTAKIDSWFGYLLVLPAGDIIRHYCPKHEQQFSSTLPYRGNQKSKIRYVYHTALLLCALYVRT